MPQFAMIIGDVTYTPDLNYAGAAQFNYTVADGDGGQATGTVSLNVQQVNDAPMAVRSTSIIVFIIGPFKIHQNGMTRSIRLTHTRIGTDRRHRRTIPYLIYIIGTTTTTVIAVVVVRNRNVIIVLQYLINILLYL